MPENFSFGATINAILSIFPRSSACIKTHSKSVFIYYDYLNVPNGSTIPPYLFDFRFTGFDSVTLLNSTCSEGKN